MLANLHDLSGLVAQDSAVAGRVLEVAGRQGEGGLVRGAVERPEDDPDVFRKKERDVAVADQDVRRRGGDLRKAGSCRVTGAFLLFLDRRPHALAELAREPSRDLIATVPDDDDDLVASGFQRRAYRVVDDGAPRDRMKDFWNGALHAGALPRGHDHGA